MNIDNPELLKLLKEHSLRPTEARLLILALLLSINDHPSPDGIVKALQQKNFSLSIATLYQNLDKLVEAGLLVRITGPDGIMHFDANLKPHHHLICDSCGRMVDVKIIQESLLQENPLPFHENFSLTNWDIHHLKLEYHGVCPDCRT